MCLIIKWLMLNSLVAIKPNYYAIMLFFKLSDVFFVHASNIQLDFSNSLMYPPMRSVVPSSLAFPAFANTLLICCNNNL